MQWCPRCCNGARDDADDAGAPTIFAGSVTAAVHVHAHLVNIFARAGGGAERSPRDIDNLQDWKNCVCY
eukprot:COSAG01_NODE_4647_length_4852_cov_3.841153_6_plen_69_part_00